MTMHKALHPRYDIDSICQKKRRRGLTIMQESVEKTT